MAAKEALITHRDLALPTKRAKPFNHSDWIFELKHDGYRVLAMRHGEETRLMSRRGNELIHWFPEIAAELLTLPDIVMDGELVIQDAQGKPDFHKLRGRCAIRDAKRIEAAARANPPAIFAFDLLELDGKDIRQLLLLKRKAILQKTLKQATRSAFAVTSASRESAYSPRPKNWDLRASSRRRLIPRIGEGARRTGSR